MKDIGAFLGLEPSLNIEDNFDYKCGLAGKWLEVR